MINSPPVESQLGPPDVFVPPNSVSILASSPGARRIPAERPTKRVIACGAAPAAPAHVVPSTEPFSTTEPIEAPIDRARTVFAVPGTSSNRTWPRQASAARSGHRTGQARIRRPLQRRTTARFCRYPASAPRHDHSRRTPCGPTFPMAWPMAPRPRHWRTLCAFLLRGRTRYGKPSAEVRRLCRPPPEARFRLKRMTLLGRSPPARRFSKARAQDRAPCPASRTNARTAPVKPQMSVHTCRNPLRANCPRGEKHRQTPRR